MKDIVITKYRVLPTIGRIFLTLFAIGGLIFMPLIIRSAINEPSPLVLVMIIIYSSITFLAIGVGPLSMRTFTFDKEVLEERIMGGLIKRKTVLTDILKFNERPSRYGNELILNKANGETIFIQEFDQSGYYELKDLLSDLLTFDPRIEPTYWNKDRKAICIALSIWYGTIFAALFLISFK